MKRTITSKNGTVIELSNVNSLITMTLVLDSEIKAVSVQWNEQNNDAATRFVQEASQQEIKTAIARFTFARDFVTSIKEVLSRANTQKAIERVSGANGSITNY